MTSEGVAKFVELSSQSDDIINGLHEQERSNRVDALVRAAADNGCDVSSDEAGELLTTIEEAKASDVDGFAFFSQQQVQLQSPVVRDFLSRYSAINTDALARISKNLYP